MRYGEGKLERRKSLVERERKEEKENGGAEVVCLCFSFFKYLALLFPENEKSVLIFAHKVMTELRDGSKCFVILTQMKVKNGVEM